MQPDGWIGLTLCTLLKGLFTILLHALVKILQIFSLINHIRDVRTWISRILHITDKKIYYNTFYPIHICIKTF
jgi:hypothetical protein